MSGDQIPSLPGKKRRQMPGVCPEGGMLKLRFDWYIRTYPLNSEKKNRKENGLKNNPRLKQITLGGSHSDLNYNFKLQQIRNLINNTQVSADSYIIYKILWSISTVK